MKRIAQLISCLALAATLAPALLFFVGRLELPAAHLCMLVAAVVWFVATPLWMEHKATD
jgi:hypothetical protein